MKWVVYDYSRHGIKILDLFEAQDHDAALALAQSRFKGEFCDVVEVNRAPALVRRALKDSGRL